MTPCGLRPPRATSGRPVNRAKALQQARFDAALRSVQSQPNRNYVSNDVIQTPRDLAAQLVAHFRPTGRCLEPCRGEGAFFDLLPAGTEWSEILEGRDFLQRPAGPDRFDWIITNPPWSQIRAFLAHAMTLADNVVFLMTINHVWTKARVRDIEEAGFALKEIVLVDMPKSFPQSGFQLGAVHVARGWTGDVKISRV